MQDAVIAMAIMVVVLAIWRLHSRPTQWGPIGAWAGSNILGSATLGLMSGSNRAEGGNRPPAIQTAVDTNQTHSASPTNTTNSNELVNTNTQLPVVAASTNLSNTNAPVTVVAVLPSELGEPPAESSAMERRLNEAGAKGGDIQISLFWKNHNDLDLHCVDPQGEEIWYSNRKSTRTRGELDVDQNAHPPYNDAPVENIYWPAGGAPPGLYRVTVVHYALHGGTDPTQFTVRLVIQGQTNFFSSAITYTVNRQAKPIRAFQYDPAGADPSRRVRFVP